jgi:colanic acid/amylovoran biosynthesis glycosyltransferase
VKQPLRALGFLACPPEDVARLVTRLFDERPDVHWDLVCFQRPVIAPPPGATIIESTGGFRVPLVLWWRSFRFSYCATYIAAAHPEKIDALRPLVAFVSFLRCPSKVMIDRAGTVRALPRLRSRALASWIATPALLSTCALVTTVGLKLFRKARMPIAKRRGRTAILIPVLPDLSHTFVYREALALKRRRPDYDLLVLEQGDHAVVHAEAAQLLRLSTPVPRLSPHRYLLVYLANWLARPARMAGLIRFFRSHTAAFAPGALAEDDLAFLRLQYLDHSNYLSLGLMLAAHLRKRRIGYVHVYGATYPAVRMLVAHHLLGIPFSMSTFVDFDYVTPFHMLPEKFGAARFVVVCTEFCAHRVAARLPELAEKIRVLHHAVDGDDICIRPLRTRDGRSRLVYIGRFVPKKGLTTLVEACALLAARGVSFSCHLYGKGPIEDVLRTMVERLGLSSSVFFEGVIANENVHTAMNHDDVFVCPSRYMPDGERDGIPVTLLEAMAAGITVVSTRVSGIPELIEHGENGYLVEPDNAFALAEVLERLLVSPGDRDKVSKRAQHTVSERFSLARAADTLDGWIRREIVPHRVLAGP